MLPPPQLPDRQGGRCTDETYGTANTAISLMKMVAAILTASRVGPRGDAAHHTRRLVIYECNTYNTYAYTTRLAEDARAQAF